MRYRLAPLGRPLAEGGMEKRLQEVMTKVGARIAAAEVEQAPFPHIHVQGCFPDDYYEELVASWPDPDEFVCEVGESIFCLYFRPTNTRSKSSRKVRAA